MAEAARLEACRVLLGVYDGLDTSIPVLVVDDYKP